MALYDSTLPLVCYQAEAEKEEVQVMLTELQDRPLKECSFEALMQQEGACILLEVTPQNIEHIAKFALDLREYNKNLPPDSKAIALLQASTEKTADPHALDTLLLHSTPVFRFS